VMMVGLNPERVLQGLAQMECENANSDGQRVFRQVADYSMPNVSDKVVRIILSYRDYVMRTCYGNL